MAGSVSLAVAMAGAYYAEEQFTAALEAAGLERFGKWPSPAPYPVLQAYEAKKAADEAMNKAVAECREVAQ